MDYEKFEEQKRSLCSCYANGIPVGNCDSRFNCAQGLNDLTDYFYIGRFYEEE